MSSFEEYKSLILREIGQSLACIEETQATELVDAILHADKVFVTGVGRTLLSMQAFAKRLNHLEIRAFCVGDLNEPAATSKDLLIVGSGSGESVCPTALAKKAASLGVRIAYIGSNPMSSLKEAADVFVRIPVKTKLNLAGEVQSGQIMTSLFEQSLYLFCDIVCLMIVQRKDCSLDGLWRLHANLE